MLVIGAHGGTWFRTPCPTVVRSLIFFDESQLRDVPSSRCSAGRNADLDGQGQDQPEQALLQPHVWILVQPFWSRPLRAPVVQLTHSACYSMDRFQSAWPAPLAPSLRSRLCGPAEPPPPPPPLFLGCWSPGRPTTSAPLSQGSEIPLARPSLCSSTPLTTSRPGRATMLLTTPPSVLT